MSGNTVKMDALEVVTAVQAARLEGIRLGLEAAAKWHDDRRDENDTVSDNSAEGKLVRVNARVWANEHDRMATAIRAITPSDVLKKGKS